MFKQEIVAFKTYDTTGQNSHAINNITINYSDSMPDSHKQVDSAVKVHRGHPSTLLELNDAFFLPGSDCLYHADGSRVTESLTRRGPDLGEIVGDTKPFARLPDHYAVVDEPLLFIARQAHHWGHFLTEGVSRLWAPIVHPALAKLKKFSLNGNANADNLHKKYCRFSPRPRHSKRRHADAWQQAAAIQENIRAGVVVFQPG